jgi:hypothetical protein
MNQEHEIESDQAETSSSSSLEVLDVEMVHVMPDSPWVTDARLQELQAKLQEGIKDELSAADANRLHFSKLEKLALFFSVPLTNMERTQLAADQAMVLATMRKDQILPLLTRYQKQAVVLTEVANLQATMALKAKENVSLKGRDKLYLKLNTFKNYPDVKKLRPDIFWRDLSRHAMNNGILEEKERAAHFYKAIQGDHNLMRWHETHLQPRSGSLTVEVLKDLFFTQTMSQYWESERLIDLCEITYRPKELVREYNTRFSEAVGDCGRNVYSEAPEDKWLRDLYLGKLPAAVRSKLAFKKPDEYANLHTLCESAATMHPESPVNYVIKPPKCRQDCSHRLLCSVRDHNGKDQGVAPLGKRSGEVYPKKETPEKKKKVHLDLKDKNNKPEGSDWKWCTHHESWGRHESDACFKVKSKDPAKGEKPYNRHLRAPAQSDYEQKLMDLDEFFDDTSYDQWVRNTFQEQPSLKATQVHISSTSAVELPIQLEAHFLKALADTGANRNFISTAYAKHLNLEITPADVSEQPIVMASNASVPQIGTCRQVKVTMAPLFANTPVRHFKVDLIVMDMDDCLQPLLLGLPTLKLFGNVVDKNCT